MDIPYANREIVATLPKSADRRKPPATDIVFYYYEQTEAAAS